MAQSGFTPANGPSGPFLVPSGPERAGSSHGHNSIDRALTEGQIRKEEDRLSTEIIRDVLGFNEWLKKRNPLDFCVDMDCTPDIADIEQIDEEEFIRRAEDHILSIRSIGFDYLKPEFELTHNRLQALITYRKELAKVKDGDTKTPYGQYLQLVDGFDEMDVDTDILDEGLGDVHEAIAYIRRVPSFHAADLREALTKYNRENLLGTPKDVRELYRLHAERFRFRFAQVLGLDLSQVDYTIVLKYADAFWKFYERVEKNGNQLWHNWHDRHREEYNRAIVEAYSSHEDSHFDIAEVVGQEIGKGNLNAVAGLMTIPGPDCHYREGLALTAHDWVDYNSTDDGKLGIALYRLEKIALVKAFYNIEHGMSIDEAKKSIARYIPLKSLADIEKLLVEGTTKPFDRAYQVIYGRSVMDFEEIGKNLSSAKKITFLKEITKRPATRNQIRGLLSHLLVA